MERDNVYTLITKKYYLGKDSFGSDLYICRPVEYQNGFISDNVFYNDNGREYRSIEDAITLNKELDECYYMDRTLEELETEFGMDSDPHTIYCFYQRLIDDAIIISSLSTEGIITTMLTSKSQLLDEKRLLLGYNDGKLLVPLDDIKEIVNTGDIDIINKFVEALDEMRESIEEFHKDSLDDDQKEPTFTEEEKSKIEKELLERAELQETAETLAKEEAASVVTKEQIRELYKELKSRVIGQDEAIETACYVIYKNGKLKDGESKTNCIFVGPTGSGKSMIIDTIGEFFKEKPVVHVDASSLTTAGYVGDNVEDCLTQLLMKAKGNKYIAEHGIVAIDEIDKKATESRDFVGRGVLNQMLRLVEGQEYKIDYFHNNEKKTTIFNTKNLTIFACGAFPDLYKELLKEKTDKNRPGFTGSIKTKKELEDERKESINKLEISHEDLAQKGRLGPELVGRFIISLLGRLTVEDLKEVMTTSSTSPLKREIQLLEEAEDVNFYHDEKFIDAIATEAFKQNTGGRGIKNTVEKLFKKIFKKVILTMDDKYIDPNSGKIYLYGTADDEGHPLVLTSDGKNILEEEPQEKVKGIEKVLKL